MSLSYAEWKDELFELFADAPSEAHDLANELDLKHDYFYANDSPQETFDSILHRVENPSLCWLS